MRSGDCVAASRTATATVPVRNDGTGSNKEKASCCADKAVKASRDEDANVLEVGVGSDETR